MVTAKQIRQQFLDFFVKQHGHTAVPSASVVPLDDPTLLFTNAGMNQFKDVFLGTGSRPYRRAVDTQKCIRAGGKHNDLEDVGRDTYHHTFFEMLGNWSFGDYFKQEAIRWAWQLLTEVWGIDKARLHATVFAGDPADGVQADDEAAELWRSVTDIDPSHIHRFGKKDNFWEMGDTGPCGPCSEIHIDRTPDRSGGKLVNKGSAEVMEIWNLVFIQFNRGADRALTPLPAKHVDTGMGFERVTAVLQGKASNYDTDVFTPIFAAIQRITGASGYTGKLDDIKDIAYRVIADHIRCLTFALTDGARPSNEKRGYVVRSILRRAERYGRQYLGTTKPFLHELVPTVIEVMGEAFPELKRAPEKVTGVIFEEEESFLRTLDRGIKLFQEVAERTRKSGGETISGKDTFTLHTTYGLFPDITEQMASEVALKVDRAGYDEEMERFRGESGKDRKKLVISAISGELPATDDAPKYEGTTANATLLGWVIENSVVREGTLPEGEEAALLVDRTCFYAEQGGQVGDGGVIRTESGRFEVSDTQRLGDAILHVGQVSAGEIRVGQRCTLEVGGLRPHIMRNHTATHLLNWALRRVLGEHIDQKGSLVDAEKTRFDFTHPQPLTAAEIAEIERLVNEKIYSDLPVRAVTMPLNQAKTLPGVRAVFGEKYPDPVRVLLIGADKPSEVTVEHSVEFCGGTHLPRTGAAGFFKIVGQEPVGKGVRRLTAVTGKEAVAAVQRLATVVDDLTGRLNCKPQELAGRLEALQDEIKKLQQQIKKGAAGDLQSVADQLFAQATEVNGSRVITGVMPAAAGEQMLQQADRLRQKAGSAVVVLGWAEEGKVGLLATVSDDLTSKGLHAGKLIGQVAQVVGGKGGGKDRMAQAGGKDASKLPEAMEKARVLATEQLKG